MTLMDIYTRAMETIGGPGCPETRHRD